MRRGGSHRVLALLMILTLVPVCTMAFPCKVSADSGHPVVVSMGDSYSSGEGVEPFYHQDDEHDEKNQDWLAHRSENSWGGKLRVPVADGEEIYLKDVKDGGEKASWYFVAASGAETKHFRNRQFKQYTKNTNRKSRNEPAFIKGKAYLDPQLDIFEKLPAGSVDYVTMTIGGNDAGFVSILTDAIMNSHEVLDPNKMYDVFTELWKKYDDHIEKDIIQAYKDVQKAAGSQAKIIVAGYPKLLKPGDINIGINVHEAVLINKNTHRFNLKIKAIVDDLRENEGMNIYFVDVEETFDGHGAYTSDPFINPAYLGAKSQDLDRTNMISAYSIHPNNSGTTAYANAVQRKIDELEREKRGESGKAGESSDTAVPGGADSSSTPGGDGKSRDIVLVLDTSGSMSGEPISEVRKATVNFTRAVTGTRSRVGLVEFKPSGRIVEKLTSKAELINAAVDILGTYGGTNMGDGFVKASEVLSESNADRKIIVLMSDGLPNVGMDSNEIIEYANELKRQGYYIYTLGFFSAASPAEKAEGQHLLEQIASEGCHYEIADASDLQFFFGDIADQINGVRYNYIRIACPVDVTVTYNGETLSSADTDKRARTSFGTLTFENAYTGQNGTYEEGDDENGGSYYYDGEYDETNVDAVKILRLREGPEYDIQITGTGDGTMDYVIGFVDDNGEYSDMRYFDGIEVCQYTEISTQAKVSDKTTMSVDYDGDGVVDKSYRAGASSHAELVDNSMVVYLVMIVFASLIAAILLLCFVTYLRKNAYKGGKA